MLINIVNIYGSEENMKKIFVKVSLLLCLLSILGFLGCTAQRRTGDNNAPSSIAWNNLIYGPSGEEVSKSELGKQLGKIQRIEKPYPQKNGDSNLTPKGSKIFEIKNVDIGNAIAIETDGKYYEFVVKEENP